MKLKNSMLAASCLEQAVPLEKAINDQFLTFTLNSNNPSSMKQVQIPQEQEHSNNYQGSIIDCGIIKWPIWPSVRFLGKRKINYESI